MENILVGSLIFNAILGLGYRVWRRTRGGPIADVWGQAVLAAALAGVAAGVAAGWGWPRWAAFAYALVFAAVVMPLWTLAVLIPLDPRLPDYAFTVAYWVVLLLIGVAALTL